MLLKVSLFYFFFGYMSTPLFVGCIIYLSILVGEVPLSSSMYCISFLLLDKNARSFATAMRGIVIEPITAPVYQTEIPV